MRKLWKWRITKRALFIKTTAAIFSGTILGGCTSGQLDQEQVEQAEEHIETACTHLQHNYEMFAEHPVTTPNDLYHLDISYLIENLDLAADAIERATEIVNRGTANPIEDAIEEVETYIEFQRRMVAIFDLPLHSSDHADRFADDYILRVLEQLDDDWNVMKEVGLLSDQFRSDPYGVADYANYLETVTPSLTFTQIGTYLAHSPDDIIEIAQNGRALVSNIRDVYQQLRAHLFIPALHETIKAIDRNLSHTLSPTAVAEDEKHILTSVRRPTHLGAISSLPESRSEYRVGADDLTVEEVETSYARFSTAIQLFEESVEELSAGNHVDSTTLWTDALMALYRAHQETPLY